MGKRPLRRAPVRPVFANGPRRRDGDPVADPDGAWRVTAYSLLMPAGWSMAPVALRVAPRAGRIPSGGRRRGASDAGLREPAHERGEVHERPGAHPADGHEAGRARGGVRPRRRHRPRCFPLPFLFRLFPAVHPFGPPRPGGTRHRADPGAQPGRAARGAGRSPERRPGRGERVRRGVARRRRPFAPRGRVGPPRDRCRRGGCSWSTTTRTPPTRSARCSRPSVRPSPSFTAGARRSRASSPSIPTPCCWTSACRASTDT